MAAVAAGLSPGMLFGCPLEPAGRHSTLTDRLRGKRLRDDLIDRAVYAQDEHAIKFTEARLREYQLNPGQIYLQAAWDAVERLRL